MRKKPSISDLFVFAWQDTEPKWRENLNRNYYDILEETGLSQDELEGILEILEQYKVIY